MSSNFLVDFNVEYDSV